MRKKISMISPLLLAMTVSACGGGSGDGTSAATSSNTGISADSAQLLAKGGIPGKPKPAGTTTTTDTSGTTTTTTTGTTSTGTTGTGTTSTGTTTTTGTTSTGTTTTGTTTTTTGTTTTGTGTTSTVTAKPYQRTVFGVNRTYNFDGATPYINPTTGQSDVSELFYNAQFIEFDAMTNAGAPSWIGKYIDGGVTVNRFQVNPSDQQIWSWRSQMSSFPFELYKTYRLEFEFKLDPSWDLNMGIPGWGLLAQAQSVHKPGQVNSAIQLNIRDSQLSFELLYPKAAMAATTWPTSLTWTNADYVPTNFTRKTITTGRYYKVRMEFFADDRPPQFGGKGYMNIWLDDQPWVQYTGPNMHPDQLDNGEHRLDFGWYNWGGQPTSTRTIYFKTARLSTL